MTREEALALWSEVRYSLISSRQKEAADVAFDALREKVGKATTSADRIRAMSDEELAEWICKRSVDRLCEIVCGDRCKAFSTLDKTCDQVCKEIVLKRLRQPAKEDAE